MQPSHLSQLLRHLREHNEKVFVVDPESDLIAVLLPWGAYQELFPKAGSLATPPISPPAPRELLDEDDGDANPVWGNPPVDWEDNISSPPAPSVTAASSPPSRPAVSVPQLEFDDVPGPMTPAEESLSAIPHEAEEEKFYLEPVE